jgi:pimeloyl-ACP methyl ester carboxylesterase
MPAIQLAYDRRGAGPTLVLIHPLGADRHVWEPVTDRIAAERDVIALDLPGFGESPVLQADGPPTPARLAEAVAAFLEGLDLAAGYHVAGNSIGGWVALELAAAAHALSVTAIAPAGLWAQPLLPKRRIARRLARAALPLLPALTRSATARRVMLAGTTFDPSRVPAEAALRLVRAYATAPGFDDVDAAMRSGRFTTLGRIGVPVTLAWADHDRLIKRPARVPSNVQTFELHRAGHLPMWDAPDQVASALLRGSSSELPRIQAKL